jgi:hypothetical protein
MVTAHHGGAALKKLRAQIVGWKVDHERYRAVPFYSDGKPGPAIELRDLFEQFLNETSWSK